MAKGTVGFRNPREDFFLWQCELGLDQLWQLVQKL